MRRVLGSLFGLILLVAAPPAFAQAVPEADVLALETAHRESIATRRALSDAVLVAGLTSTAGGAALMVPDAEDQGFRFAGINTALFGVINTVVALLALRGIAGEEAEWGSASAAAARRQPGGLARARVHAALDERREATSHAVNLGLGAGYLGVGAAAILASRLGVDHPNRWLGSGVAIGAQAIFLVAIDWVGLRRAAHFHRMFVEGLLPTVSVVPSARGTETRLVVGGVF